MPRDAFTRNRKMRLTPIALATSKRYRFLFHLNLNIPIGRGLLEHKNTLCVLKCGGSVWKVVGCAGLGELRLRVGDSDHQVVTLRHAAIATKPSYLKRTAFVYRCVCSVYLCFWVCVFVKIKIQIYNYIWFSISWQSGTNHLHGSTARRLRLGLRLVLRGPPATTIGFYWRPMIYAECWRLILILSDDRRLDSFRCIEQDSLLTEAAQL